MAADFRAAADVLPNHWDESGPGQRTLGHNRDRTNKFHTLGYLGKALMYAGSTMMNEGATGSNTFNTELCKPAAYAFGELQKTADRNGIYKIQAREIGNSIYG